MMLCFVMVLVAGGQVASVSQTTTLAERNLAAEYASYSGLYSALNALNENGPEDVSWEQPHEGALLRGHRTFSVKVFDNTGVGATDTTAPDGTPVAAGMIYLSSEGWAGQSSRKVLQGFAVPSGGGRVFDHAVVADRLDFRAGFQVSSYDSGLGLPEEAIAAVPGAASVATNSVSSGAVTMEPDVSIDGPVLVGPGGGSGVVLAHPSARFGGVVAMSQLRALRGPLQANISTCL